MVKNSGGNKAKKFASKSFIVSNRATRFASEQGEIYAVVQCMFGGNICEVLCIDGIIRLCIIRGKFSGKGKRDNRLSKGSWILVGLRDWEISSSNKKQKTDLLEVYNDGDKEKLIKNSRENFRIFLSINNQEDIIDDEHIKFINEREEILTNELNHDTSILQDKIGDDQEDEEDQKDNNKNMSSVLNQINWINIDDI